MSEDPRVTEWKEKMRSKMPELQKGWHKVAMREKGLSDNPRKKRKLEPNERDWNEYDFQKHFNRWFAKNHDKFSTTCLIELKSDEKRYINYKEVRDVQHKALEACSTAHGVYHQIQSAAYKQQSAKPSDSFFIRDAKGYVAVMFEVKTKGNFDFYMIPYPAWCEEESKRERESLTLERAAVIGVRCFIDESCRDR